MSDNSREIAENEGRQSEFRKLPSVDGLLSSEGAAELIDKFGHALTVQAARDSLDLWRERIASSEYSAPDEETIVGEIKSWLSDHLTPSLRPVVNATGVIVHTNLGRAPLSRAAVEAAASVAESYSNLEFDLEEGARGSRADHVEKLLTTLTGAQAGLVVNNNAAAVLLMLTALCRGREVIISRGQLIEIGGGFRLPEVMNQSGATLVEVGTTNRTHITDFEDAIGEETSAIMVAHPSNYRVVGFTSEPSLEELASLARTKDILLLYDQGSGAVLETGQFDLQGDPTVGNALSQGVDVIAFSGDKLLGGPQAGILCGRKDLVAILKQHPLARAVRADKLCLAALSATLASFLRGGAANELPIWQMIGQPLDAIEARAARWVRDLAANGIETAVIHGESTIGGGSMPGTAIETRLVALRSRQPDKIARCLRLQRPPIIARISDDQVLFDPRTVFMGQEEDLLSAITQCVKEMT